MSDICDGCEGDGTCQIQDDKDSSKYGCLINSRWEDIWSKLETTKNHVMKVKFESNHFPLSYDGKFLMVDYRWVDPIPYWEELLRLLGCSEFKEKGENEN